MDTSRSAALLEALAWLCVMRVAMACWPFRRIASRLGLTRACTDDAASAATLSAARQVAWAVQAVARRTPWPSKCLVQALAGMAMLRRRQLPGTLYFGVRKQAGPHTGLDAHAWVCCGNAALIGQPRDNEFVVVGVFRGPTHVGLPVP
ncbi:MAG: lasso peptide biosynthesis B2 protein [Acidobacteriota bacterium]